MNDSPQIQNSSSNLPHTPSTLRQEHLDGVQEVVQEMKRCRRPNHIPFHGCVDNQMPLWFYRQNQNSHRKSNDCEGCQLQRRIKENPQSRRQRYADVDQRLLDIEKHGIKPSSEYQKYRKSIITSAFLQHSHTNSLWYRRWHCSVDRESSRCIYTSFAFAEPSPEFPEIALFNRGFKASSDGRTRGDSKHWRYPSSFTWNQSHEDDLYYHRFWVRSCGSWCMFARANMVAASVKATWA